MAKNIRRIFAMIMVVAMFVSVLPMQTLAAEDTSITETPTITGGDIIITFTPTEDEDKSDVDVSGTNESGATVDLEGTAKTDSNSGTDSNGTVTETVTTEVTLGGTETTADGTKKTVTYEETIIDTTVTEADGTVTEVVVKDGSETKEWDEKDSGDEPGQPKVDLELIPGETTNGEAVTETTVPNPDGSVTTTTTTERTASATTSDITVTESEHLSTELDPLDVVEKTDAKDLTWKDLIPDPGNAEDVFGNGAAPLSIYDEIVIDGETRWVPRFERREDQMLPELMEYYTEKITESTDEAGNPVITKTYVPIEREGAINYTTSNGEYFLFGEGEISATNYYMFVENGGAVSGGACSIRVCDEYGNVMYTYCMDFGTKTFPDNAYILENLKDADYFAGTEEEQQAAKDQIRAIAQKGYWGTESGMGSLDQIKADLKAFIENNPDFTFTYSIPSVLTKNPQEQTFSAEENKEYLIELVELLNEAGALTVTQSAIWEYNRGVVDIDQVYKYRGDEKLNQAMVLFREYLLSEEIKETVSLQETIIYDQDSFLAEGSLELSVGDKIADSAWNADEDDTNDEYNVDLSFKLVVAPGEDDDLVICLVDSNNTVVRKARIAGEAKEGEVSDEIILREDGSYTFVDVPLQENSNIAFNLTLEGIQHLEQGVYIYKAVMDDGSASYDHAQTLVGVGEGSRNVDVTTAFTVNFNVEENNHIVTETVWHDEYDPSTNPPEDPDYPPEEEEDPPVIYRLDPEAEEEIPEEPVPLAAPVVTGDNSFLWILVVMMAVCGIVVINVSGKKNYAA